MIRMLPLITPKALTNIPFNSRLADVSHMAEERKRIEEADDDRAVHKVEKFAWQVLSALDDVTHRMNILKQESRGVQDSRVQGLIRNIDRHISAAEKGIRQIAK